MKDEFNLVKFLKENKLTQNTREITEDHTKNPKDTYRVKKCKNPKQPWAVWEGDVRVKVFTSKEEAKDYVDKQTKKHKLHESLWDSLDDYSLDDYREGDAGFEDLMDAVDSFFPPETEENERLSYEVERAFSRGEIDAEEFLWSPSAPSRVVADIARQIGLLPEKGNSKMREAISASDDDDEDFEDPFLKDYDPEIEDTLLQGRKQEFELDPEDGIDDDPFAAEDGDFISDEDDDFIPDEDDDFIPDEEEYNSLPARSLRRALRVAQREANEYGYKKLYLILHNGLYTTSLFQKGKVVAILTARSDSKRQ